jgi:Tfp pilus assembly protein PilN
VIPPAPNLARRPFANTRPATRAGVALWLAGVLLFAGNVAVYYSYYASSADKRAALAEIEGRTTREEATARDLETALARIDLAAQNEQVEFLNRKIAERAFSWSLLFDRLAEVLPDEVRLASLRPEGVVEDERKTTRELARARTVEQGRVRLDVVGEAKNGEALLRFVDNLFAHPAFDEPDLAYEATEAGNAIEFKLVVEYLPAVAETAPTAPTAPVIEEVSEDLEEPVAYPIEEEN